MAKEIEATEEEVMEGTEGACLNCGERSYGVEPDATNYKCESCDEDQVFGLEELVLMGKVKLVSHRAE